MGFSIDPALLGLEDAVALVTGAGHNIAKGCAIALARAGCHVSVVDLDAEAGEATVKEIEALGRRAVSIEADVRDPDGVQYMVDETLRRLGSLEVACNVVGNPGHAVKPFLDTTLDEWNTTMHRNLGTAFLGTKAEAIAMIERRIPGRIINFASSSGVVGAPTIADYGAANAGVIHFTKSAAMEVARYGLRVNCVVPGTHGREGVELSEFAKLAAKAPPLGRLGPPGGHRRRGRVSGVEPVVVHDRPRRVLRRRGRPHHRQAPGRSRHDRRGHRPRRVDPRGLRRPGRPLPVGVHVGLDVRGPAGQALVAVFQGDGCGHARIVDVVPEDLFGQQQRGPGVAGHHRGVGEGGVEEGVVGDDLGHQPHPFGFGGADLPARQDEIEGARGADQPGQGVGDADVGAGQPGADEGRAEAGRGSGQADIGRAGQYRGRLRRRGR